MAKDSQGSSHHLKVVGGAYGKRKDLIYEKKTGDSSMPDGGNDAVFRLHAEYQ